MCQYTLRTLSIGLNFCRFVYLANFGHIMVSLSFPHNPFSKLGYYCLCCDLLGQFSQLYISGFILFCLVNLITRYSFLNEMCLCNQSLPVASLMYKVTLDSLTPFQWPSLLPSAYFSSLPHNTSSCIFFTSPKHSSPYRLCEYLNYFLC